MAIYINNSYYNIVIINPKTHNPLDAVKHKDTAGHLFGQ